MNPGRSVADGEKALGEVLDGVRNKPVEFKELEKAKNQQISEDVLGRLTVQEADAIGGAAVIGHDPDLANTSLGRFLQVTAADIERAAKEYFAKSERTVLLIEPPKPAAK